jgi:hypothetical protein
MAALRKDERANAMYKLYQQGKSLSEVAIAFDVTRQTVYKIFATRGFAFRPLPIRKPYQEFNWNKYTKGRNGDRHLWPEVLFNFISAYPQPALMGQPQHDWEPPRVATGVKNRAARLKALGNAVDPLQIYPVLYAIKLIDDWLRGQ